MQVKTNNSHFSALSLIKGHLMVLILFALCHIRICGKTTSYSMACLLGTIQVPLRTTLRILLLQIKSLLEGNEQIARISFYVSNRSSIIFKVTTLIVLKSKKFVRSAQVSLSKRVLVIAQSLTLVAFALDLEGVIGAIFHFCV